METVYFDAQRAAETLHRLVPGESVAYWQDVLADARTHQRPAPFTLAAVPGAAGPRYQLTELCRFAKVILDLGEQPAKPGRPAPVADDQMA